MIFLYIFLSVAIVSLISFIGVVFVSLKEKSLHYLINVFVAFACGSLLGGGFLHLLPEAVTEIGEKAFGLTLISFLVFFALEKFLHWRHCHQGDCPQHLFAYLNLLGDGLHNFLDGASIAAAFLTNIWLGINTTLAVILHEIPQEIGDFSILVYAGFSKRKALFFNFLSALTAIIGAFSVYFFASKIVNFIPFFLPFTAGGFIYIATTDLIPQLHQKEKIKESVFQFFLIFSGFALMWLLKE